MNTTPLFYAALFFSHGMNKYGFSFTIIDNQHIIKKKMDQPRALQ